MKEHVLPEGWGNPKLLDLCDIKTGKVDANHHSNDGIYPFFTCALEPLKSKTYSFDDELIILPGNGANVGTVFYYNGKIEAYQRTYVLHKIQANPKFIYFHLLYLWKERTAKKQFGSATNYIRMSNFEEYSLPLPPLPEQQYLSQKLTALLDEVAQTKQRLEAIPAQLKQFRQSVLADAVSGRLTEENADKWNTQPLKSLTTKIGSGSTPKGGNDVYKDSGIPFVRSLNIHTYFIKYEDLVFIDEVQAEKLKNVKIKENDVLLNITGASIGRVNIAPKEFVNGRVNQHVAIIRLKQEVILPKFLHLILASPKFQKWIEGENYGTTRQALTKGMLETLEIHYPDIARQTKIVQKVETYFAFADEIEAQVNAALENVNLLTQSILAKAFSGELSAEWRTQQAVKN